MHGRISSDVFWICWAVGAARVVRIDEEAFDHVLFSSRELGQKRRDFGLDFSYDKVLEVRRLQIVLLHREDGRGDRLVPAKVRQEGLPLGSPPEILEEEVDVARDEGPCLDIAVFRLLV